MSSVEGQKLSFFGGFLSSFRFGEVTSRGGRRTVVASVAFAVLYALSLQLGINLSKTGTLCLGETATWFFVFLMTAVSVFCIFLACRVAGVLRLRDSRSRTFFDLTHPLLFSWMLIIAAWLPVVLARWPGDFCFDAMWQTAFILPDKTNTPEYWAHLNSWHPPLHSLWLGGSLYLGWSLFQSYSIGLALYTVSQVLLFSFCVARVVSYVYERGHCVLFIFSLLAACLFSGFAVYATMTTKDVAFSGLFSLSVLWVYRSVTDDYDRKRGAWLLSGFSFFLLSMLLRNNAIHAYILITVILAVARMTGKTEIKDLISPLGAAIVCALLITGPLYAACGIEPGPAKEVMSVPSVQLSSVLKDHRAELSDEDVSYLTRLIPDWEKYDHSLLADETKMRFDTSLVSEDPIRFASLYVRLAIAFPGSYLNAWSLLSAGYWSQAIDYSASETGCLSFPLMCPYEAVRGTLPEYLAIPFERPVPVLSDILDKVLSLQVECKIPFVGVLFRAATWFWLLLASIAVSYATSTPFRRLLPSLLLLSYCTTLFLGPGSIYRYASPLFICAPLILMLIIELAGEGVNCKDALVGGSVRN